MKIKLRFSYKHYLSKILGPNYDSFRDATKKLVKQKSG